jgi:hypothetical protein
LLDFLDMYMHVSCKSIVGGYISLSVLAQDADVTISLKKEQLSAGDIEKAQLGKSHLEPIILM